MRRRAAYRVLGIAVLVAALLAMSVHYGAAWADHERYRTSVERIEANYDAYLGRPVYLWLTVDSTSDGGFVAGSGGGGTRRLAVASDANVSPGDVVQVYGVLRPGDRVDAERVVVHDRGNRLRMDVVSGVGALLALGAFFSRWRVDRRSWAFVPRDATDPDGGGGSDGG
ncbi:MAG: hypothetical protein ABEJ28_00505 [Salinigranum sp.]